jgi:hypothetical protein
MEIIQMFALIFWGVITLFGLAGFSAEYSIHGFKKQSLWLLLPFLLMTTVAIISYFR